MDKKGNTGFFSRIKYFKNVEIYIIVFLILVALLAFVTTTDKGSASVHTEEERRLSATLSKIKGAGEVECMITSDGEKITGVVIVATGGDDVAVKNELVRAACYALNVANSRVEVFDRK